MIFVGRGLTIMTEYRVTKGFVEGTVKRSISNIVHGKAWDRVHNVVMGWLLSVIDGFFQSSMKR